MQEEPLGSRGVSGSTQDWSWYKMHGHIMILSKARLRHYDGAWVGIGRPPISLYRMPPTSSDAKNKNWSHQAFFRFCSCFVWLLLCPRYLRSQISSSGSGEEAPTLSGQNCPQWPTDKMGEHSNQANFTLVLPSPSPVVDQLSQLMF